MSASSSILSSASINPHFKQLALHAGASAFAAILAAFVPLPSFLLQGLFTYIHPDHVPGASSNGLRAAIRRPSADDGGAPSPDLKKRSKSKSSKGSGQDFDEAKAQLFRLRLAGPHLRTRVFFPPFRLCFIAAFVSIPSLILGRFFSPSDSGSPSPIPFFLTILAALYALLSLAKATLERSATKRSERQLAALLGFFGFLLALVIQLPLSPAIFDFRLGGATSSPTTALAAAAVAGFLAWILFIPATRVARSFWIGTDQLRWNLGVVSCGTLGRAVLYLSFLINVLAALLWFNPVAEVPAGAVGSDSFPTFRICCLLAAAVSQLLAIRPNVQMYLNEAVLSWYQRLHASKVPDLDFGRAKVFLHDHYLCAVALQSFAPSILVLLFLGVSQVRGNLFGGCLEDCSSLLKEISLFIAWWIVFVSSAFTCSTLALLRFGFLFIS